MYKLSIIIPTFNSAAYIFNVLETIRKDVEKNLVDVEWILINDGGKLDVTERILDFKETSGCHVKIIELDKVYGQQKSIMIGLEHSLSDCMVTLDDDLNYNPSDIAILYNSLISRSDKDIISGYAKSRKSNKHYIGFFRFILKLIVALTFPLYSNTKYFTPFKIFRRTMLFSGNKWKGKNIYFFWEFNPRRMSYVSIKAFQRIERESNYNSNKYFFFFIHILIKVMSRMLIVLLFCVLLYSYYVKSFNFSILIMLFLLFFLFEFILLTIRSKKAKIKKII